jgi:hypothetical protein
MPFMYMTAVIAVTDKIARFEVNPSIWGNYCGLS